MALKGMGIRGKVRLEKKGLPHSQWSVEEDWLDWQMQELGHKPKSESNYSKSLEIS